MVAERVPEGVEDTEGEGENVGLTLLQGEGVEVTVSGPPFQLLEGTGVGHAVIAEEKVETEVDVRVDLPRDGEEEPVLEGDCVTDLVGETFVEVEGEILDDLEGKGE